MPAQPTVLIVDDNEVMRSVLRAILREQHYPVIGEARNGLAAVEQVQKLNPGLVLMDVIMPEMGGIEALGEIKSKFPQTLVVMVTGNASADNVREALQGGADGFIVKPFNTAKVLDTLTQVCARPRRTPPTPARSTGGKE